MLLDSGPIYKDNVKDVIDDGFVKVEDVCTPSSPTRAPRRASSSTKL